ncbi:hypothetical protein NHQ30_009167 [Ciborinia camelliae]|nr:hypothetical protein NHQ30_009167 [Ciborinia camelliae]
MQLLTVVGAIAVLSNVVSAVPQPHEKVIGPPIFFSPADNAPGENHRKRWNWPWSTSSGNSGHGNGGGGWGWGGGWGGDDEDDNDDDDDDDNNGADDDDDSAALNQPLLPFTHPHLRAEETGAGSGVSTSTVLSSSSLIGLSTATDFPLSAGPLAGDSTAPILSGVLASSVSTVTDPTLSATSIIVNTSATPTPLEPATSAIPSPQSSVNIIIIDPASQASSPPHATLLLSQSAPLTLCAANPTSIMTITASYTSTQWVTVVASGSWTVTPLPSSVSASPSGVPPSGSNSTGLWTLTPVASSSRGWTTSLSFANSSSATRTISSSSFFLLSSSSSSSSSSSLSNFSSSLTAISTLTSTPVQTTISPSESLSLSLPLSLSPSSPSSEATSTTLLTSTSTIPLSSLSLPATPISIGSTDLHPSTTVPFTTTVTTVQVSGTPNPAAVHCGLHGLPVGDFFLAEFVEDKAGVDVTLKGCWEFCRGIYGIDKGCVSYSFYPEPGTGAPRCDLFGGSVAQSLDSIIPSVPNVWFDLECGDPTVGVL